MIIIPFTHDRMTVFHFPYLTVGLVVLSTAIHFATCSKIETQEEEKNGLLKDFELYYLSHDYLELPEPFLDRQERLFVEMYQANREWTAWALASPDEARAYVEREEENLRIQGASGLAENLAEMFGSPASTSRKARELAARMPRSEERKLQFVSRLAGITRDRMDNEQILINAMWDEIESARRKSILDRFAYVPKAPRAAAFFGHLFLHAGVLHLVINMLFLWLAGAILEDMWGRWIFGLAFLTFGAASTIVSHLAHPESLAYHVGASGAVAGLMGAFLFRQARARVRCFYAYMLFFWPRYGTFEMPAWLLLPLWLFGEILYAWVGLGGVDHWAHIGGFLSGAGVGIAFLATNFERRFLGYVPVEAFYESVDPNRIVAYDLAKKEPSLAEAKTSRPPKPAAVAAAAIPAAQHKPETARLKQGPRPSAEPKAPTRPPSPLGGPAGKVWPRMESREAPPMKPGEYLPFEPSPRFDMQSMSGVVATGLEAFEFTELVVTAVLPDSLEGKAYGNVPMQILVEDIHYVAVGSIERPDPGRDGRYFYHGVPDGPIYVMVLVGEQDAQQIPRMVKGYFIDGERLPYRDLLPRASKSLRENFWEFSQLVRSFMPQARFIQRQGAFQNEDIPVYDNLDEFLFQIRAST